jgi:hypothetical protein
LVSNSWLTEVDAVEEKAEEVKTKEEDVED